MSVPLVIGVDAGATTTRCVVATADGSVLARGRSVGANQNSSGGDPAAALTEAIAAALSDVDSAQRARVAMGVVGAAGAAAAGRPEAIAAVQAAWRALGLPGRVASVTDLEVAFAAGAPSGEGLLLLSGTGAVSAAFSRFTIRHRCDGYGWLLGDEGSAVWLGREAVRAVLRALDGRDRPTALTGPVTDTLATTADSDPAQHAQALLRVVYRQPPALLGRLAPLVSDAATGGDPVAGRLVEAAAGHLLDALDAVARRAGSPAAPTVVLAGSVLLSPGPVADRVRAGLRERFDTEPALALDGAAGAAALAIAHLTGQPPTGAVHDRLTAVEFSRGYSE